MFQSMYWLRFCFGLFCRVCLVLFRFCVFFFFFKQKTAYEMRISDWSSDVCSSDLAAAAQLRLTHPEDADLAFLYGTIFTDGSDACVEAATRNVCVFAGRQVDRSPTGSGVAARLALQWTRGEIALGQPRQFESLTGTRFTGTVVEETRAGPYRAVVAEISGTAHYTGSARFTLEADDPLGAGFLLD